MVDTSLPEMPKKFGRYLIEKELGRGGMAVVYLAKDPDMSRQVAIKVLSKALDTSDSTYARFQQEVKIVAALEHPAIVPIYDVGEEDGQPFFVMRHMSGGTLRQYMKGEPLDPQLALKIVQRLAGGLDRAHQAGIVHRDLKPGNILLDNEGDAYLSDFGIAKLQTTNTLQTGERIIGTPEYLSPEQAKGGQELDGRSDVYALGVMLYEMLTGELPYQVDSWEAYVAQHLFGAVPRVSDVQPDLSEECDEVVAMAMAKEPMARFATATALTEALSLALTPGKGVEVRAILRGATTDKTETAVFPSRPSLSQLLPEPILTTSMRLKQQITGLPLWMKWGIVIVVLGIAFTLWGNRIIATAEPSPTPPLLLTSTMTRPAPLSPTLTETRLPSATPQPVAPNALLFLTFGSGAVWQQGNVLQWIPENGRLPLANSSEPLTLQTDDSLMELLLPDRTKLYLDGNTILDIVAIAGVNGAEETVLQLRSGRLVVIPVNQLVSVQHVRGVQASLTAGLMGVEVEDAFVVDCLQEVCVLQSDEADTVEFMAGEQLVVREGEIVGSLPARLELYMNIVNQVPTLTPVPTTTATATATASATPSLTPTPTRDLSGKGPEVIEIGRSVQGRPIEAVRFGNGSRVFVFVGGLAGGYAPNSMALAEELVAYFSQHLEVIPERATLYIVPNMAPDNLDGEGPFGGRLNANGVGLNRNWDCRWRADPEIAGQIVEGGGGISPYSEPEVKAVADFIEVVEPTAVLFWLARNKPGFVSPGACQTFAQVSTSLAQLYAEAADYDAYEGEVEANLTLYGDAVNSLDERGVPAAAVLLPYFESTDFEENLAGVLAVLNVYRGPDFTVAPAATATPCLPILESFDILSAPYGSQLGCPTSGLLSPDAAYQHFEGGLMIWRGDTDDVYVLYDGGGLSVRRVTSAEPYAETDLLKGAFGYLWLTDGTISDRLGQPQMAEDVANDVVLQDFERGTAVYYSDDGQVYVLFVADGGWTAVGP